MDTKVKDEFIRLWNEYFDGAELPIVFYYTDDERHAELVKPGAGPRCIIGHLTKVRHGESLGFNLDSVGCPGGKRYLGFTNVILPGFEYFLSCGKPGVMEGERYKKSPEIVRQFMENMPELKAPDKLAVFKRWDALEEADNPEVVIFFARPDVLSGLFTLANFDQVEQAVVAPFGSGCMSIIQYPYLEKESACPKAILGMFDVSARPYVPEDTLTLAIPMNRFLTMIENMQESFLITGSWENILKRISRQGD